MKKYLAIFLICFFFLPAFAGSKVLLIKIDGVIGPPAQEFILNSIEKAEDNGVECLIIQMDTPGGLDKSTREIIQGILASRVPVVLYVAPSGSRAGSAGVYIAMACHVVSMAPGTNIGAAHPVALGMGSPDSADVSLEKATNDAAAFMRSLAEMRNRNVEWAEKSVRESISSTEKEALESNIIDFISVDINDLLKKLNGLEVEIEEETFILETAYAEVIEEDMPWNLRILDIITDPNIAYILMLLGMYGLMFELYNPGSILPGVVGVISIVLAFFALQTLPVNFAGLILILFSMILFILELKIVSHGMLTVGGIISLILGSIMLFDSPLPYLRVSWTVIIPAVILTVLFFAVAIGLGLRAQARKVSTGYEGLVDEEGVAITDIKETGKVRVHGEIWKACSDEKIKKGDEIKVVKMEKLKLTVKKI